MYGYFRVHAHARSFKELMTDAAVPTTINPGWAVAALVLYSVVNTQSARLGFDEITEGAALVLALIDVFSVVIVVGLLLHLQGNLNRYWDSLMGVTAESARIGASEVIVAGIGMFVWADTVATLLSPSYRALGAS